MFLEIFFKSAWRYAWERYWEGDRRRRDLLSNNKQCRTQGYKTGHTHCKKSFSIFPSPAGMSLTKFSMGRNNLYMTSQFPPRESLVSDIPAEDRNIEKPFFTVQRPQSALYQVLRSLTAQYWTRFLFSNIFWCSPNNLVDSESHILYTESSKCSVSF